MGLINSLYHAAVDAKNELKSPPELATEVHQLIWEVRKNEGEACVLCGHVGITHDQRPVFWLGRQEPNSIDKSICIYKDLRKHLAAFQPALDEVCQSSTIIDLPYELLAVAIAHELRKKLATAYSSVFKPKFSYTVIGSSTDYESAKSSYDKSAIASLHNKAGIQYQLELTSAGAAERRRDEIRKDFPGGSAYTISAS